MPTKDPKIKVPPKTQKKKKKQPCPKKKKKKSPHLQVLSSLISQKPLLGGQNKRGSIPQPPEKAPPLFENYFLSAPFKKVTSSPRPKK